MTLRLQTQSGPPGDEGRYGDCGGEVAGKLVIAGGNSAPILQAAEHAFDQIALFVGNRIKRMEAFAGWVVGNDGLGAPGDQELAQAVAVVGGVASATPCRRERREQGQDHAHVAELARRYFDRDRPPLTVNDGVDLRRPSAARATDGLRRGPPFPPAAERCALAVVLSID